MPFLLAWLVVFLIRGLCSMYLAFILASRYSFVSIDPILIFIPSDGSSSSCPCHIEDFFLELLSHMPTLSWGVQWSACLSGLRYMMSVLRLLPFAIWRASS